MSEKHIDDEGFGWKDGEKYGCHCDLMPGQEPDPCVTHSGDHWACAYGVLESGRNRRSPWPCKYWKSFKSLPQPPQEKES